MNLCLKASGSLPKLFLAILACAVCYFDGGAISYSHARAEAKAPSAYSADEAYLKAREFYGKGDFDKALEWLKHANTKESRAIFVFNMARILEAKGQLSEALRRVYQQYRLHMHGGGWSHASAMW